MHSYGPLHMAEQKQGDQLEPTYSSSVRIRCVALRTCRKRWTIGRGGESGSGISVLMAWLDDDDDNEFTFMVQKSGIVVFYAYGSCINYCSATRINISVIFFRLTRSNQCARREKFEDKTDSKGHIFLKQYTKNPGIRKCNKILWWRS